MIILKIILGTITTYFVFSFILLLLHLLKRCIEHNWTIFEHMKWYQILYEIFMNILLMPFRVILVIWDEL